MSLLVEARGVSAGGTHTERERFPPVFEGGMLDAHGEMRLLDLAHACRLEELRQVSLSRARQRGFVFDVGIELVHCGPK